MNGDEVKVQAEDVRQGAVVGQGRKGRALRAWLPQRSPGSAYGFRLDVTPLVRADLIRVRHAVGQERGLEDVLAEVAVFHDAVQAIFHAVLIDDEMRRVDLIRDVEEHILQKQKNNGLKK